MLHTSLLHRACYNPDTERRRKKPASDSKVSESQSLNHFQRIETQSAAEEQCRIQSTGIQRRSEARRSRASRRGRLRNEELRECVISLLKERYSPELISGFLQVHTE